MQSGIDTTRWAIFFVFGLPFLGLLFFSRSNPLKVIAALAVLVFVQNSFAARQYLWAIGVGPSIITVYVVFLSLLLQRRALPNLGAAWALWALFLLTALAGVVVGSIGSGEMIWNVIALQEYYFEGFIFFLVGALAFSRDEELRRFLFLVVMIGLFVSLGYGFTLITGYRFRDFNPAGEGALANEADGFFAHPNTQGAFFSMTIPMALVLLSGPRLGKLQRMLALTSVIFMVGSLLQSVHRGGILTTGLLSVLTITFSVRRPGTAIAMLAAGAIGVGASYLLVATLLPDIADAALKLAAHKGIQSPRFYFWPLYLQMISDYPLGVGLSSYDIINASRPYGITLASTHNLYLAVLVQVGFAGLFAFLGLVSWVLSRIRRAWTAVKDPGRRQLLLAVALPVLGFLVVGMSEPVWENGYKINQLFWFWCGLSLSLSLRTIREARGAAGKHETRFAEFSSIPDFGEVATPPTRSGS